MTDWFYEQAHWIVDKDDPTKTAARIVALTFAVLPLVALVVLAIK